MKSFKRLIALIAVLIFSVAVFGCSSSKTVATVNGEKITQKQLDKEIEKQTTALEKQGVSFKTAQGKQMLTALQEQTLQQMIQKTLLMQAAEKEKVIPSKAEMDKKYQELIKSSGGQEAFKKQLKEYKYTEDEVKDKLKQDTALSNLYKKVTDTVKVTEQDAEAYYNQNKSSFIEPDKISARAIMIKFGVMTDPMTGAQKPGGRSQEDALAIAKQAIQDLNKGVEFAKVSSTINDDATLRDNDGVVKGQDGKSEYYKGTVMPAEFDDAALALNVGQFTQKPVLVGGKAYYVIKLENKTLSKQLTFKEAKKLIMDQLPNLRKQEAFNNYYLKLEKSAKIEKKLPQKTQTKSNQQDLNSIPSKNQLPAGHPNIQQ